jgi:hypothetical protein
MEYNMRTLARYIIDGTETNTFSAKIAYIDSCRLIKSMDMLIRFQKKSMYLWSAQSDYNIMPYRVCNYINDRDFHLMLDCGVGYAVTANMDKLYIMMDGCTEIDYVNHKYLVSLEVSALDLKSK